MMLAYLLESLLASLLWFALGSIVTIAYLDWRYPQDHHFDHLHHPKGTHRKRHR